MHQQTQLARNPPPCLLFIADRSMPCADSVNACEDPACAWRHVFVAEHGGAPTVDWQPAFAEENGTKRRR